MVEREQVDLTNNFLISLMEEQLDIQQHVAVDFTNKPIVHNGDTLRHLASRIVEEATTVTSRGLAEDVLSRAGIDNHLPAEPQIKSGHLMHVGTKLGMVILLQVLQDWEQVHGSRMVLEM